MAGSPEVSAAHKELKCTALLYRKDTFMAVQYIKLLSFRYFITVPSVGEGENNSFINMPQHYKE